MEISSFTQEEDGRSTARTLSDISIASNASGKAQNFGGPKHVRVKFLCSHGGKIMPRPSDKRLRYVGGETRMMSVPRHIHFKALLLKLTEIYGPDVTLKYQLPEEDLDALVSVSSDEDLENMMEESDRLDAMEGSSRLRVFVFSSLDHDAIDFNDIADPKVSEHRYVEAVNTIQMDASLRQSENMDSYRTSSGFHSSCAMSTATMQERASENLQSAVLPPEQFVPSGNLPNSKFQAWNNASGGQIAPLPRVAITRQWNEPGSTQYVNNTNFQGAPTALDDFLDMDSSESASSSASSQHDLHRYRWGSNSQMQSHREPSAYRIEEDHLSRADQRHIVDVRGQGEAPDSNVYATLAAPTLPIKVLPEIAEHFETVKDMKNPVNEVLEEQPLSPGALLQRQLLADQHPLETDSSRHFRREGSQSSLDKNMKQPIPAFNLLHENQQIEQLHFHNPAKLYTQEEMLARGPLLLDPFNLAGKVHPLPQDLLFPTSATPASLTGQIEIAEKPAVMSQQMKLQEASLFPPPLPHVEYTRFGQNNGGGDFDGFAGLVPQSFTETPSAPFSHAYSTDNNEMSEVDKFLHQVHPSVMVFPAQRASNGLDSAIASQGAWLAPEYASFPLGESGQVETLHQNRVQNKMTSAMGITTNQLSLLDQPVDNESKLFSTTISEVKGDQESVIRKDCCTIGIMSDMLTSGPSLNYCSSQPSRTDGIALTTLDPMAKLGQDVADNISGILLKGNSGDTKLGFFQGADSLKQPMHQENAARFSADDGVTKLNMKGSFDVINEEGPATTGEAMQPPSFSASTSQKEVWNTKLQLEHEQHTAMLHVSRQEDVKETGSTLVMEKELIIESSKFEVEEEDTFKSAADSSINAAAIAETEAIARGLQTIRNFDLEELKELGSGTFGTVYHGKWRGSDVAIKRIKSSCFTGRPSERERLIADFWQEAYILGQLHHPNVVAFYGVVPDGPDGTLATVTEFMVNGSLKQALQKKDRVLDRRKRLLIAMDAAFGMEYLHKKNVVHFDLKCENLLVNLRDLQRPICKVGDLGLSKVKQQTMISGGVRGTLPWMAPELLNGSSSLVSEKVDVFSFGIVLWELLTGDEPYASMHYGAIIGGIVTNTLRPPVPTWCDAAWKSLMEACWAADPAERPTFSEIASSLRAMEAALNAKGQAQAPVVE